VSELRFLLEMDDTLYDLFAPALTVSLTPGINVNQMKEPTLRALLPGATAEEITKFFEFRDSELQDNSFRSADDFFKYLQQGFAFFRNDESEVRRYRENLDRRGVRIVTDETNFRITIRAEVGKATRVLEADVTLQDRRSATQNPNTPGLPAPPAPPPGTPGVPPISGPGPNQNPSGFKVTFMRIY
jgi:type II secretory pathway component PulK